SDYDKVQLPQKRDDKFWMEWITFRCHTVAEFHKRLRTVARQYNPHFMISGNVFGGFGYGPIAYDAAGNMEMLAREGYDDFIYSEMQEFLDSAPRKDENGTKITNSPALKFLAAASHGKPTIIYATEITPPIFPDPTEKCLSAMAQINIAEAVANHAIFREKRQTPPGATDMYRFLSANEKYLVGAQLHSNIAVLASLNQYLADEQSFAFSLSRVLADQGIAHQMIVEDDLLLADLTRYDLIIIPYLPLLSAQKQEALKAYAEHGGKVLLLGNCGFKNEFNVPQQAIVLASLFEGSQYPNQMTVRKYGQGSVFFIPLTIPDSKFLIPLKKKGEVTTFGPEMADVFADIPEGYTRNRMDPELRQILENVVQKTIELLDDQTTRILSAAPYVELTTMLNQKENCLLVHLVNYDVTVDGTITPCKNLKIQLALPEGKKAKSVRYSGSLSELMPIEFGTIEKKGRQIVTFGVDEVQVYGLGIVELN
ncbi:MAG: beta-galactosidase trimerization domain-containing protein, partial [candidate division KSB1 bacterium]|nr:beta-galactosidase trimerization domain-containing protein [candidate division KSB1 bacterium]